MDNNELFTDNELLDDAALDQVAGGNRVKLLINLVRVGIVFAADAVADLITGR